MGLGELEVGDTLLSRYGLVTVAQVTSHPAAPVYNIGVDGQHVYEVTEWGIICHNNGWRFPCKKYQALLEKEKNGTLSHDEANELSKLKEQRQRLDENRVVVPSGRKKPPYSPEFDKWVALEGGTVEFIDEGCLYTDRNGFSVLYVDDLYPDFERTGAMHATAYINAVGDHNGKDYKAAREDLRRQGYSDTEIAEFFDSQEYTPHHHERGKKLQFVLQWVHKKFPHKGFVSLNKERKSK